MKHLFIAIVTTIMLIFFFLTYALWFSFYYIWNFKVYPFKKYATVKGEYLFEDIYNYKDFFLSLFYINK